MASKGIQTRVDGMDDISRKLARLKDAVANRVMRGAVDKGTRIIAKAAKSNVPQSHGLLKKSLGSRVRVYRGTGVVVGIVGARGGFLVVDADGTRRDPRKYAHLVEKGRTVVTAVKKKALANGQRVYGVRVRQYAGHPFLQPAIVSTQGAVNQTIADEVMSGIEKELEV
jgi:HK97 gp10 family phage protein